jgi:hypothetical protein
MSWYRRARRVAVITTRAASFVRVNADLSEITCMQVRQVPAPRQQCNASPRHSHYEKLARGLLT